MIETSIFSLALKTNKQLTCTSSKKVPLVKLEELNFTLPNQKFTRRIRIFSA